jgi:hypothetical protein
VKDADALLRELCGASSRLQEAHYFAKKAGQAELAAEILRAANVIADQIGKLITRNAACVEVTS